MESPRNKFDLEPDIELERGSRVMEAWRHAAQKHRDFAVARREHKKADTVATLQRKIEEKEKLSRRVSTAAFYASQAFDVELLNDDGWVFANGTVLGIDTQKGTLRLADASGEELAIPYVYLPETAYGGEVTASYQPAFSMRIVSLHHDSLFEY